MESSSRRALIDFPPVAGVKRPAEDSTPTLLPAFEPISSPSLPRPAKRVARASLDENCVPKLSPQKYSNGRSKYPTPVPTSSTGIFSSSPPRLSKTRWPGPERTASTLSQRAPLASVPSIELDITGEPLLMGRSGKSSHYQMANSKYISRVHVRAAYLPANKTHPSRVEVMCMGSNGVKIQCQGKDWELGHEESFTSECEDIDIMVEVAGARVILRWPTAVVKALTPDDTDSNTDRENSPRRRNQGVVQRSPFSSPLRNRARFQSPISPSPADRNPSSIIVDTLQATSAPIQIYEDAEEPQSLEEPEGPTQPTQPMSQPLGRKVSSTHGDNESDLSDRDDENEPILQSFCQKASSIHGDDESDHSDRDEENEPLVHAMGPFGDNLLPRMASFTTGTSQDDQAETSLKKNIGPSRQQPFGEADKNNTVLNHIVNQLAYSRLSSVPLSTLMNNLPSELKEGNLERDRLEQRALKALIDRTNCIGEVPRAGKDAAGKTLESEYYYIPEKDFDPARRASVVDDLRKPGLRNCRKQHKQYFWRKPK